jgi:hypothetical protein
MAGTLCTRQKGALLKMSNPQTQLYSFLAESRSRSSDIQQIRQRAAARLPQAEQALMAEVDQLRLAPLGEDYLDALTDLSNIRKSITVNDRGQTLQKATQRQGETKTVDGITYALNENARWVRQKGEATSQQSTPAPPRASDALHIEAIRHDNETFGNVLGAETLTAIRRESTNERDLHTKLKAKVMQHLANNPPQSAQPVANVSPRSHTEFIDVGTSRFGHLLTQIEQSAIELEPIEREFAEANTSFDRVLDEMDLDFTAAFASPTGKYYDAVQRKRGLAVRDHEQKTTEIMQGIRQQLLSKPRIDTSKVKINANAVADISKTEMRAEIDDFMQMSGGLGLKRLDKIAYRSDRAHADEDKREINIGKNGSDAKAVLWHELAHFIEFERPDIAKAAMGWIEGRRTGEKQQINTIAGCEHLEDDEIAYPDNFIDPYVGKFYSDGATEVISMGLQYFTDAESMATLYAKDPEHFHLIAGILSHA